MLSVLAGLLVELVAIVPAGFDLVPESVSVTVMVNIAATPAGVLAVSGLMVVDVARAATVSVAALVVAVCVPLQVFVNTARYLFPLALTGGEVSVNVVLVAPVMFVKPEPVSTCHCTVGVGLPLAAAVKLALAP